MQNNYFDVIQKNMSLILISLMFFLLPVLPKIVPLILTLLLILSFFNKEKINLKTIPLVYYSFPIVFILYLLSYFFSDNIDFWSKDIESKLSFLIIPLLFLKVNSSVFKFKSIILISFILGIILSSILSLIKGGECYDIHHARFCYESSHFAFNFHPTYLGLYYVVAIFFVWIQTVNTAFNKYWLILSVIITPYLFYFIYHFYSIGTWMAFLIASITILFYYFSIKKQLKWFFIVIAICTVLISSSFSKLALFESDYNAISNELVEFNKSPKQYYEKNKGNTSSVKARLIIWGVSLELIKDNILGVGGGDVKDVLIERYNKLGLETYAQKKLNPHNQYFQTTLALGIVSGLFLIVMLFVFVYNAFKSKNINLLILITLLASIMTVESFLENQAGIVFFTFFIYYYISLFIYEKRENE